MESVVFLRSGMRKRDIEVLKNFGGSENFSISAHE